ncbi:AraC family transcriptional regulator ligand-binding domain-containing protein [Paraliomyxa miuraensis]|uniref:AraC family transcriptional regulator ligand-binding domain-containing protein n=1 Tax=Paraliomyxa miuraensis TaxID=376150 RepID=UPI00224DB0D0|nr:AraC family transcriptional regulator ligand-binding domain-containing protein [Paraliomyxa miuraensis]MCX4242536.1 AraC family transcriptional regulator ligand-binding domain-containing protein [Paraliomyxa miuraensis]
MPFERSPSPASSPPLLYARVDAARPLALMLGEHHPVVQALGLGRARAGEERLPLASLDALWDALVTLQGPSAPLRLGEQMRASSFGLLTYVLGCAPSGEHALRRLASIYGELLSEGTGYEIAVDRRHVEVAVTLHGAGRSAGAALFSIASVVGFVAGEVEGGPRPRCVDVTTEAPSPRTADAFARFFGGPVRHGASRSRLVYERAALERPMRGSDPALAEILEEAVRTRRIASRSAPGPTRGLALPPTPTTDALRGVLLAAGARASVGQDQAAAALGQSPRSLRRRLADEGTSFQAVVDQVRRNLAEAWLAVPGTPVAAVAEALGYADAAAFRRAFRRWTGTSPAAHGRLVRRDQAPGITPVSTSASPSTSSSITSTGMQLSTPSSSPVS